jgi:hypothetical protein
MNGRRGVVGLCLLGALLISVVAAQGASARGTTVFTCKRRSVEFGVGFSQEHCKRADAVSEGARFEHVEVPRSTTTEVSITNARTNIGTSAAEPTFLAGTIAGIPVEIKASVVSGGGSLSNSEFGSEMIATGKGKLLYSEVTVVKPSGLGCKVTGGKFETVELRMKTESQPIPEEESNSQMFVQFEPVLIPEVARIRIEGCSTASLNNTFVLSGSVKGRPDGATIGFTSEDTKTQNTLKLAGQTATLNGKITWSGKASADTSFTPLSVTTK